MWNSASTVLLEKLEKLRGDDDTSPVSAKLKDVLVDYTLVSSVFSTKGKPVGKGPVLITKGINPFAPTDKGSGFAEGETVLATRAGGLAHPKYAIDEDLRRFFKAKVMARKVIPKLGGSYEVSYDVKFNHDPHGEIYHDLPPSSLIECNEGEV